MNPFDYVTNLARAITDKADATPRAQLVPATVKAFFASPDRSLPIAEVHVHGDPDEHTIHAQVITGQLEPGDMTVVLFDPPEAAYAWGHAPVTADWTITPNIETSDTTETYPYTFDGGFTIGDVVISGSVTGGAGAVFTVRKNGLDVASLTVTGTPATLAVNTAFTNGDEVVFAVAQADGGDPSAYSIGFTATLEGDHPNEVVDWLGIG